jgi:uncharacterized LabA/DUF88 family protein
MTKIKTFLYVDGSNLYGGISELLNKGEYIYFAQILKEVDKDYNIDRVKFYATYLLEEPKSVLSKRRFIKAQHEFIKSARMVDKVEFHKGYFSPTSKKEKGVDVKMAVDMVKDVYEENCDQTIIMSGDDDFLYAIKCIRALNKPVHLAAFASRFPYGIAHNANQRIVYDFNDHFKAKALSKLKKPPVNLKIRRLSVKVNKALI